MVLGIMTAIAACPAIIGTTEAVRQGQRQNAREKHRGLKTNLSIVCSRATKGGREIDGCELVLSENKLYLNVPSDEFPEGHPEDHPFAGYFLPYPDQDWGRQGEGMVSTISDDPPQLNWIYIDRDTCEVKYGDRITSEPHIVGPWDVTKMDRRVMLTGWEGFMAVRYGPGEWALYFDVDDNGLQGVVGEELLKMEVELVRREKRQERTSTGPATVAEAKATEGNDAA
ncbi:uncharacterized protein K460DRAFT_293636 [Cucurbitaria berberidis CBS 394.84]|uniref:Uncharacterized protein n=1 Tax=Cucurbitaria berberidis CBS 394.84 TaxID=1168544 RepID=A0A9P4GBX2_9PLEO|nr:uncharacterized protein K460DRAFT_293636 [Cucurbitaria berberidis CBS 394.84]KAF1842592.1 hypothetical protein K460DRAFT_293636 [Cucurbitaria berberidis CBS 394.84]